MIIQIKVKTGAKEDSINKGDSNNNYLVSTRKRAVDGEANVAVIKIIAEYFHVAKSSVKIKTGASSRIKIIEL